MILKEFIEKFDQENSIVLLEGKRKVLEEDKEKLVALGKLLESRTKKMIFRSGNADGSDQYFPNGVTSVDPKRLQVVIPYTGHRKKTTGLMKAFPWMMSILPANLRWSTSRRTIKRPKN